MGRPVGLVLAGGVGRRLGRSKGDLDLGQGPLAHRAGAVLASLCAGVSISIAAGSENPAPEFPAIEDPPPAGRGPLAGIHAALTSIGSGDLLVLACDYPRVDRDLLERLLGAVETEDEVVLPVAGGKPHPLVAFWRGRTAERIGEALSAGRNGVLALIETFHVRRLDARDFPGFDLERALTNVNRPADLESLQ